MNQAEVFDQEKLWLESCLRFRFGTIFSISSSSDYPDASRLESKEEKIRIQKDLSLIIPPALSGNECLYAAFIVSQELDFAERLLLAFAFLPNVYPALFLPIPNPKLKPEFGFMRGVSSEALVPTGQSFIYLYSGLYTEKKFEAMELLLGKSLLFEKSLILLDEASLGEPLYSGRLMMSKAWTRFFILNEQSMEKQFYDFEIASEDDAN